MTKSLRLGGVLISLLALSALLAACDDDDGGAGSSTPIITSTTAVPSPPAINTRTGDPTLTATPSIAPLPPTDGTVPAQGFGSTDPVEVKSNPDPFNGIATLADVRVGAHPEQGGWDRIVFEFRGSQPPGEVRYDTRQAVQCGSGNPVTVRGSVRMFVRFDQTQAHNEQGQATVQRRELIGPGGAIIEAKQTCDFEGVVEWVIGVDARERFSVRKLDNPTRVVIDIKQ